MMRKPADTRGAARWYRRLLRIYPPAFRERFAQDQVELFADLYEQTPPARRLAFWRGIVLDTLRHGGRERLTRQPRLPFRGERRRGHAMRQMLEDLRDGLRVLTRDPWTSAAIVLTLALSIGANSAIFTVVNAVLLRPLPYESPDRVIILREVDPRGRNAGLSLPAFEDLRSELTTIGGLSLFDPQTVNLTGVSEPERLRGGFVSAGFFDMLGVQPVIGRSFAPGEDAPGAAKTAVLAYRVWQQRFGSEPGIIGRPLVLNNEPHVVIGVTPPGFEFPIDDLDVWLPHSSYPIQDRERSSRSATVLGRLLPGISDEAAIAELQQKARHWAAAYPDTNRQWSLRFERFHDVVVGRVGRNLTLIFGAVGCVLLIACANIANLLLARGASRQREAAVRAALGASRLRLVTQTLAESLVLALIGGGLGLVGGVLLTDSMLTLLPSLPRADRVSPDARVVLFTTALSIATALLFGLAPALRVSRADLRPPLSEGARGGESRTTSRFRAGLVVAELALSLVLLVGAGLFTQSLRRLTSVDLGYQPEQVLTLEYRLPRNKYRGSSQQWAFHEQVVERLAVIPGVQAAAIASSVPQSGNGALLGVWRSDDQQPPRDEMPRAQYNGVTDDYFRALSIPVVAGRVCGPQDVPDESLHVIVNQLMAERLWPGISPLGKRIRALDVPVEGVVIGVVGNTRPQLLSDPFRMQLYGCFRQQPGIFATVVVKTVGPPLNVSRSVQQAIWSVDPEQPMWKIRSADMMIRSSVQYDRFVMLLLSLAAGLAVFLAVLGTYSVLSHTVQRRAREVGVRVALGATSGSIVRLILTQTAMLVACGLALGVAASFALRKVVEQQLYEISPADPGTLILSAITLGAAALIAAWLPTRRALSVDAIVTLRADS